MSRKEIPFKGSYWWSDSKEVTEPLKEELVKIISETRISSIVVHGTDFNDGRENRSVEICIIDGKITIEKSYQ